MKNNLDAYETLIHSLEDLAQSGGHNLHLSPSQKKELLSGYKDYQQWIHSAPKLFLKYDKKHQARHVIEKISRNLSTLDEHDLDKLLHTAFEAYNKNDLTTTLSMLSFIITLMPLYIKAYLLMANTIWKLKGTSHAAQFYETITKLIPDPLIYFYAADCIAHNGNKARAIELLNQARQWCKDQETNSIHQNLLHKIDAYSKELLH